jgi:hypothetical protein
MSNIPDDTLMMRIVGSAETTRKVQRESFLKLGVQYPGKSVKELFRMVLVARSNAGEYGQISKGTTEREIDQAMGNIDSFEDLCSYVIAQDEQEQKFPDPLGIGKEIDGILLQEELDNKAPAESLIESLEKMYFDLRRTNQDRDEHWLLANIWLEKYGSTQEARQKGPELTKFTAYKDTYIPSVLESPKSIRALALFLVHRSVGEKHAVYYFSEFSQLVEPAHEYVKSGIFLDKYKQKNLAHIGFKVKR